MRLGWWLHMPAAKSPRRGRAQRGLSSALALLALPLVSLPPAVAATADGRLRLLFDDYYQIDRTGHAFSQGVALKAADRSLSNFYYPEANGIPNGTFVTTQSIADKFQVSISQQPIDEALLRSADVYMLVCPLKPEAGGRAALTEKEGALLEDFVARGGRLVLILNSISSSGKTNFDLPGVNGIARRFGVEFQTEETGTLSVPIARDHPLFDEASSVIYGNGTTLRILPSADPATLAVLNDPREKSAHAPVAVLASFKKGKVLLLGDSGTIGNAHMFRSDLDHAKAVREMFYGLLPDGPAPAYGWKPGQRMKVRIKHEQVISGYPYGNRLLTLLKAEGSEVLQTEARLLDLDSSPDKKAAAEKSRYVSTFLRKEVSLHLSIGTFDGRAYAATWKTEAGESLASRILPKGRVLELSATGKDLTAWQWAIDSELLCAPLKPYAKPGESWEAQGLSALPHAQLSPVPTMIQSPSTFRFEGEASSDGKACYLFTRTTVLNLGQAPLRDFVGAESVTALEADGIKVLAGGQYAVTRYWISRDTLLPVRTETRISSGIWYKDAKFPDRYEGTHDWRNFENWKEINFVATLGRLITADFESE